MSTYFCYSVNLKTLLIARKYKLISTHAEDSGSPATFYKQFLHLTSQLVSKCEPWKTVTCLLGGWKTSRIPAVQDTGEEKELLGKEILTSQQKWHIAPHWDQAQVWGRRSTAKETDPQPSSLHPYVSCPLLSNSGRQVSPTAIRHWSSLPIQTVLILEDRTRVTTLGCLLV